MNATKWKLLTLLLAAIVAVGLSSPAAASPATGMNPNLPANGQIYIPLKPSTSGTLGSGNIGLVADSVTLSGTQTSSGDLSFSLFFDISPEITPENPQLVSGTLLLTFRDLDFQPVQTGIAYTYSERLAVQYDGNTPLQLNKDNYGFFGPGFVATNDGVALTYEIDLAGDLGVTPAQFAQISADKNLTILLTLYSDTQHLRTASNTVRNSYENIQNNDFKFTGVPEPATLAMLCAVGSG